MKIKHIYILFIASLLLATSFCACSDDDDNTITTTSKIEVDSDSIVIALGENNKAIVNITNGSGQYRILPIDSEIIEAKIEDNKIEIKALKQGRTNIVIMDNKGSVKNISVVNIVNELTIKEEIIKIEHIYGISTSLEVFFTSGNGYYEVTVENEDIIVAKGTKNSVVLENIANEGTTSITVTDAYGIQAKFTVEVVSIPVFTEAEIESFKQNTSISYNFHYNMTKEYPIEQINTVEGGINTIGYSLYNNRYYLKLFFSGDKNVGIKTNVKLDYSFAGNPTFSSDNLPYFEIVKNDGKNIWIMFMHAEGDKLYKGKIVADL